MAYVYLKILERDRAAVYALRAIPIDEADRVASIVGESLHLDCVAEDVLGNAIKVYPSPRCVVRP